ncbi:MAG: Gfo/Idh/MocA family oxidoreductase [Actinomycetota bacterium]|nr:Gfo/Idh/MocA family oxidoreductase [Actinomycetota bacterium]
MRFGLVGTGYWARVAHAAALDGAEGTDLVGVWGRDPSKASALAEEFGATGFEDFDAMLDTVDAVSFSVPPDVQAPLAARAARAGKHLLLEKPVALDRREAAEVADAVGEAGVASVVFFTARFDPAMREWTRSTADAGPWEGASAHWVASVFASDSPFATPWRREKGGLWDVGPHSLAMLSATAGPITAVTAAARGPRDLVHVLVEHDSGAASSVTVGLDSAGAELHRLVVWGAGGVRDMPESDTPVTTSLGVALGELIAAAGSGDPSHPCDVHFGRRVVDLLADAQELLGRG